MKNLKVSAKLIISFSIVLFLFAVSVGVGILSIQDIKTNVTQFYNGAYESRGYSNNLKINFERVQKFTFRATGTEDVTITDESVASARSSFEAVHTAFSDLKKSYTDNPSAINELETAFTKINPILTELFTLSAANQNVEARTLMEAELLPLLRTTTSTLDKIIEDVNQDGFVMLAKIGTSQTQSVIILLSMCGVSIILGIILCLYITKSITGALRKMKNASEALSKGDLKTNIDYDSKDEIGDVANSLRHTISTLGKIIADINYLLSSMGNGNFNIKSMDSSLYVGDFSAILASLRAINENLSSTLFQINQSADQVSTGSDQMASGAQILAQGATEQASSVEELAATIAIISDNIKSNAANANDASQKADNLGSTISQSNERMQEMIGSMAEISNSSNEISKIIKLIEDIAFQTNILALNAAVEAARAGAAGKGFAVVAGEVRDLASKSAAAANNTTNLIENSIKAVENGTRIADDTATMLNAVVADTDDVIRTIGLITSASNEQASAVSQVTEGIDQISKVVQTNSATAEESAASSQELSSHAQLLKSLIDKFELKSSHTSSVSIHEAAPSRTKRSNINIDMTPSTSEDKYSLGSKY